MRIGQGFDAHRFASHDAGKPLWLACLRWDGDGIEGDSDGDVAAHALIDALLSAAGLGDIGMLFGVGSDSAGAGKHGDEMLRATVAYLRAHGMRPVSASVVVVANRPKIGKRRDEAQQALSHAIGCEVSLTATTTDGMGFTSARWWTGLPLMQAITSSIPTTIQSMSVMSTWLPCGTRTVP